VFATTASSVAGFDRSFAGSSLNTSKSAFAPSFRTTSRSGRRLRFFQRISGFDEISELFRGWIFQSAVLKLIA
jgi:hypothetical protein